MKKTHYIILCLLGVVLAGTSCNKGKTYAELLKDETRAINKFILENKLIILDKFPDNLVFKSNEFYRDPATGVYFNIIEPGDTAAAKKVKEGEEVYVRFQGLRYFTSKNDTTEYSNLDPIRSPFPENIIYRGPVTVRSRSLYSGTIPGWAVPLTYVGHAGRVKMIVPFNMGSQSDQRSYSTTYYDNIQYRLESQS
ncbi:MAG TPA: DUF4827 domain-containing protein [Petrimonas sp.]|uniref:DUF4827 family protein n=1 Tax=Petrimonas sp. TaxID=2023866 RepID=UPI00096271CE|nr:DUF4827 family protein [Petrimonas sp.]OJV38852.1 MAG: hypothetical protein BGO33_09595 [Bacteroidia bacterium 43-41]MEA4979636.1 DUF4827 family protein [Petrimonas sp.]MEA5046878.1 DUF4827 family protein [Petrimonas sp.]MEA5064398.1 DUF4827 family protein [Petrimonas sp.]